jgi:hypothetical protein
MSNSARWPGDTRAHPGDPAALPQLCQHVDQVLSVGIVPCSISYHRLLLSLAVLAMNRLAQWAPQANLAREGCGTITSSSRCNRRSDLLVRRPSGNIGAGNRLVEAPRIDVLVTTAGAAAQLGAAFHVVNESRPGIVPSMFSLRQKRFHFYDQGAVSGVAPTGEKCW